MFNFKLIFTTGAVFNSINERLKQIEGIHLGILIHSLRYKNKKEGIEKKKEFFESLRKEILLINKDIALFNKMIRFGLNKYTNIEQLQPISLTLIKKIIYKHKGDLPTETKGLDGYMSDLFAENDSASSLSRKNTIMKLQNVLFITKQSLGNFAKSLDKLKEPYGNILESKNIREGIKNEIEKSMSCYSIGLTGEATLIIGRILEKLTEDYLIKLNKKKRINYTLRIIKEADFDTKIDLLKKEKAISPSQHSKILAVKWDRNIFSHPSKQVDIKITIKDAKAIISLGCNLIEFFEKKLTL